MGGGGQAPSRVIIIKGMGFRQRLNNANLQFRFRESETCGEDIENKEVVGQRFPLPSFLFPVREGIGRPAGKESGRVLSCDKASPFPSPRAVREPQGLDRPHQPGGDSILQTMGGKERKTMRLPMVPMTSSNARPGLDSENPRLEVPRSDRSMCFHSPHPIVQDGKVQTVWMGPLTVNSCGNLKAEEGF